MAKIPERWKHIYEQTEPNVYLPIAFKKPVVRSLIEEIVELREIVHLFCTYAPLSGDIALMIRASQPGGDEAHERANKLIEYYAHLNEAHDKGRKVLENG